MPLKTPLPEELSSFPFEVARNYSRDTLEQFYKRDKTLNQLITYLAELTEVVEGKQKMSYQEKSIRDLTPTLKEQLSEAISKLPRIAGTTRFVDSADVEAIINRLIP